MEVIKNLQKHGTSKCVVLDSWILKYLGIIKQIKLTIEPTRIIIERIDKNGNQEV